MKAMQTRIYTNVILTVIAVLLAVLALQPVLQFSSNAYAQRERDFGSNLSSQLNPEREDFGTEFGEQAAAQREIASAIKQLAEAVQASGEMASESADAQRDIADAIRSLGNL